MSILDGIKFEPNNFEFNGIKYNVPNPVHFKNFDVMMLVFLASAKEVAKAIKNPYIEPMKPLPGKAVVIVSAIEFKDINCFKPYNEMNIGTIVKRKGLKIDKKDPTIHIYSFHMPVTGQDALDCGIGISGFPKIKADIRFQESGNIRKCSCSIANQKVVDLEVSKPPIAMSRSPQILYTQKETQSFQLKFLMEGNTGKAERKNAKGSISIGDHPIGQFLQSLKIGKSPMIVSYGKDVQALLFKPESL